VVPLRGEELIVWQSDLSWLAGALARQHPTLRVGLRSLFGLLAGQRRGDHAAGHLISMRSCFVPDRQPTNWSTQTSLPRLQGRRRGGTQGNFPQACSHLALTEVMPRMIVLDRRAEL
jgi:hypothetical protein